jgi:hypothetical protein
MDQKEYLFTNTCKMISFLLPLIDEDFCLLLIGDEERGTLDRFFVVVDERSP